LVIFWSIIVDSSRKGSFLIKAKRLNFKKKKFILNLKKLS
jgi:hypothetical protein